MQVSVPFFSDSGQYQGDGALFHAQTDRVARIVQKIVRGLYWKHKHRLLGNVTIEISHFDPALQHNKNDLLPETLLGAYFSKYGTVLNYAFVTGHRFPRKSVWWLQFYGKPLFVVKTFTPEKLQ